MLEPISEGDGLEVQGPAFLTAEQGSDGLEVTVVSGTVQATTSEARELRTLLAVTRGQNATWTVAAASTHVEVLRGEVTVAPVGEPDHAVHLTPGRAADVSSEGNIRVLPLPPSAANDNGVGNDDAGTGDAGNDEEDRWRRAEKALERGDRSAAEPLLRALSSSAGNPRWRDRASFALGEIELARGDVNSARARFSRLVTATDPSLAEDATRLLCRWTPSATEQGELWARFLSVPRPEPYLSRANKARATIATGE
jgi:hypothetical protein